MKNLYLSLLLLLGGMASLFGQNNGELIRPLDFISQLEDVYVDGAGFGWAGGSCGVLLKTENDGQDWTQVTPPLDADVRSVTCATSGCQTNLLVLFETEEIARSTDNGQTWSIINLPNSNAFPDRIQTFSDDIYLALSNNDEILRSTDGGSSWVIQQFPSYMSTALSMPTSNSGFFMNGDGKLYKTLDQGATWDSTDYTHPATPRHLSFWTETMGYMIDQDRDLYRTNDGGESFFLVNDDTGLPSNLRLFVALNDTQIRGVQVTDRVWESNDMGANWSSYSIDLGDGTFVKSNFHQRGDEFWLVSNMSSIFYSAADFSNWTQQIPGERLDASDMVFTDNETGYYTERGGALYKSTDAGETWTLINTLFAPFNQLFLAPDGRLMVVGGANQPMVSNDGVTFTDYLPSSILDQYPNDYFYRIAELPSGRIYLAAADVAIYSDDDGTTWNAIDLSTLNVNPQNQLYFFDDNLGFMVDNGGGRIARTTDGGLSWEDLTAISPTSQPIQRAYFTDPDNGILFTSSRAYRTTDGGDTWTIDNTLPGASDYEITPAGQLLTAAFASGNNGTTSLSNDNGASWSEFSYVCAPFRGSALTPDGRYFFGFGDGGMVYRYNMDLVNPTRESVLFIEDLKVFPNPASDLINVDISAYNSTARIQLMDLRGQLLKEQPTSPGQTIVTLAVDQFPAGMYVLRLLDATGVSAVKRVVLN